MTQLHDQDLADLLRCGESDRVERKRNAADLDRMREAVCAFANDLPDRRQSGVLFVGVEDDGACADLPISDELLRTLAQLGDDGGLTPFPTMSVRRAVIGGCAVAVVVVAPATNPPIRCKGRTWIRVRPRRAVATPEEEQRRIEKRQWRTLPFDAQAMAGTSLDDLDLVRFRLKYLPSLVSGDTIAQNQRTTEQQRRALRLIDANGVPTTTAILMLGISPLAQGSEIARSTLAANGNPPASFEFPPPEAPAWMHVTVTASA